MNSCPDFEEELDENVPLPPKRIPLVTVNPLEIEK